MAVEIALASEGIRPDLQVEAQYGYISVQADYYESVIEAIREACYQYPQANWVIYVVISQSYGLYTASGVAAYLTTRTG